MSTEIDDVGGLAPPKIVSVEKAFEMMAVDNVIEERLGVYGVVSDKLDSYVKGTATIENNFAYESRPGEVYYKASAHDHEVYARVVNRENHEYMTAYIESNSTPPKDMPPEILAEQVKAALADVGLRDAVAHLDLKDQPAIFEGEHKYDPLPADVVASLEKEASVVFSTNAHLGPDYVDPYDEVALENAKYEGGTASSRADGASKSNAVPESPAQGDMLGPSEPIQADGGNRTQEGSSARGEQNSASETAALADGRVRDQDELHAQASTVEGSKSRESLTPNENERKSDSGAAVGLEDTYENRKTFGASDQNDVASGFGNLREGGQGRDKLVFTGDPEVLQRFQQTLEAKGLMRNIDGHRTIMANDKKIEKIWKESAAHVNKLRGSDGANSVGAEQIGTVRFKAERVGFIANTIGRVMPSTGVVKVYAAGTESQRNEQTANFDSFVGELKKSNLTVEGVGKNITATSDYLRDAINVANKSLRQGSAENGEQSTKSEQVQSGSESASGTATKASPEATSAKASAPSSDIGNRLEAMAKDPQSALNASRKSSETVPVLNGLRLTQEFRGELGNGLKNVPTDERAATLANFGAFNQKMLELANSDNKTINGPSRDIAGNIALHKGEKLQDGIYTELKKGVETIPGFKDQYTAKVAELVKDGVLTDKQANSLNTLMAAAEATAASKAIARNDPLSSASPRAEASAEREAQMQGGAKSAVVSAGLTPGASADPVLSVSPGGPKSPEAGTAPEKTGATTATAGATGTSATAEATASSSAQASAQPQAVDVSKLDLGNAYSATSGSITATAATAQSGGQRLADSDPLAGVSPGVDRRTEPAIDIAVNKSTEQVSGTSAPTQASATATATAEDGATKTGEAQAQVQTATTSGQASAGAEGKATATPATAEASSPSADAVKSAAQAESLRDRIESIASAGPQSLTQERVTSLMADLEGRRGLSLDRVDNGEGGKPTETLSRLENILNFAASGKFDAATSVQAQSLQSELTRWKEQDSARGGPTQAASHAGGKDAESWKDAIAAVSASNAAESSSAAQSATPAAATGSATTTAKAAPAQEIVPGKSVSAPEQVASTGSSESKAVGVQASAPTEASHAQTVARVNTLSEAFSNPANKFVTRNEKWNTGKITETAQAIVGLNEKELGRMNPEKITEMAAFAAWMSRSANEGQIPGFNGEKGGELKEKLEEKANALVKLAADKGADISPAVEKNIQRGDNLLSAMDTHQRYQEAASVASSRESTVAALKGYSPLVEDSMKAASQRGEKSEAVDIRAGVKPVQDVAVSTAKESLQAYSGAITESGVKNILKNAGTLTPENLQSMDKDTLAKAMVSLEVISSNLRDGSLMGPVDQLSKSMQSNLTVLEKAVDTLKNSFGKASDMVGSLIKAHEGFGKQSGGTENSASEAVGAKGKTGRAGSMEL